MSFSTKYLAEAVTLFGIAWAIIRWIGRSLLDIAGGSRDAEGRRFLESVWRSPAAPKEQTLLEHPSHETAATMTEAERQAIYDDLVRRLESDAVSPAERAFALAVARKRLMRAEGAGGARG